MERRSGRPGKSLHPTAQNPNDGFVTTAGQFLIHRLAAWSHSDPRDLLPQQWRKVTEHVFGSFPAEQQRDDSVPGRGTDLHAAALHPRETHPRLAVVHILLAHNLLLGFPIFSCSACSPAS